MGRTPEGPWRRADRPGWYYKHGGKRYRLNIPDDSSKTTARRAWLEAVSTPAPPPTFGVSLRSIMQQFLAERVGTRSFRDYGRPMASFVRFVADADPLELTPNHVTRWLAENPTWGPTTKFNAVTAVKGILQWAVREGLIDRNPIAAARKPKPATRDYVFTPAEAMLAISAAEGPFQAFIVMLHHTGARPSEIARAVKEHAEPNGICLHLPTGKQGARTIHVPESLRDWLRRHRDAARPGAPLFPNTRGEAWTTSAWCQAWETVRRRAGLPPEAAPYQFRHTWITRQVRAGVPLAIVAQAVGTSIKMISDRYARLAPSDVAAWLTRFQ